MNDVVDKLKAENARLVHDIDLANKTLIEQQLEIAKLKAELEAARLHYKVVEHEADVFCKQRDEARQAAEQAKERLQELAEKVVEASANGSKNFYASVKLARAILA